MEKFFTQESFATSQFSSLILKGPKASGKTCLLNIYAKRSGAQFLKKEEISKLNLPDFLLPDHFYILEDINEIKDEELLLRLINSAVEAQAFLALSERENTEFKLRDLVSRLKNIFCVEIKNPGHDAMEQLLVKGFADKQIKLPHRLIEFIISHTERKYCAILEAINKVENFCQENGRNISRKNLAEIFEK